MDKLGLVNSETMRQINTMALIRAIEKYPIKILTHPGAKIDIDTRMLAKKAAELGVALEINASHGFMTEEYVRIALEEGAVFAINSDAHSPDQVGDFQRGLQIAKMPECLRAELSIQKQLLGCINLRSGYTMRFIIVTGLSGAGKTLCNSLPGRPGFFLHRQPAA